jgi:hypothetical protein
VRSIWCIISLHLYHWLQQATTGIEAPLGAPMQGLTMLMNFIFIGERRVHTEFVAPRRTGDAPMRPSRRPLAGGRK